MQFFLVKVALINCLSRVKGANLLHYKDAIGILCGLLILAIFKVGREDARIY